MMTAVSLLEAAYIITICKDVAGVVGNIFAFGLFVSPIPTFRRIVRNRSTEHFSGLPYIYTLLNCLLCAWYGSPLVSSGNILIMTVNSIGAAFQLIYITLFIAYAADKINMLGLVTAVFILVGTLVFVSMVFFSSDSRRMFVGIVSCASIVSMFASPLFIISLVIRTRSVEYMPFYLSLSSFLMSVSFCAYGIFNDYDPFVYVPNGIGIVLGSVQLGVYSYYRKHTSSASAAPGGEQHPLIVSYP